MVGLARELVDACPYASDPRVDELLQVIAAPVAAEFALDDQAIVTPT